MNFLLLAIAVMIGLCRFTMPHRELSLVGSYQALAHIFLGLLLGAGLASPRKNWFLFVIVGALTVVEVIAFATSR